MKNVLEVTLISLLATGLAAAADAKAGKASWDKACKSCHGTAGEPNAAIAKSLKVDMRHIGAKEVQSRSDEELKNAITQGHGKMRPVKTISGAAADDVVAYMRTLKQ